jgi:nucleoside-diphosphate-sugar epimerase
VYVKDVARVLYETALLEPAGVSVFNLTYQSAPTIETICKTMAEVTHLDVPKLTIPSGVLRAGATGISLLSGFLGKRAAGIHPDRVKKLMISTNIDGIKLSQSPYKLQFTLKEAVADWYKDCGEQGLY